MIFSLYVKIKPANSLYDAQLPVKFLFRCIHAVQIVLQ